MSEKRRGKDRVYARKRGEGGGGIGEGGKGRKGLEKRGERVRKRGKEEG